TVASSSVHRLAPVAVSDWTHGDSRVEAKRQREVARRTLFSFDHGHCAFLQSGTLLGNALAHIGGRVLALVGGPSLGRRLLRSFCYRRDRVSICKAWRHSRRERGESFTSFRCDLSDGWHHWHAASSLLCRHTNSRVGTRVCF